MYTIKRIEPLIYLLAIIFALIFVSRLRSQDGGNAIDLYNENYLAHGDFIDCGSPNYGFTNKVTVCAWVKWNVNPQTYMNNHNEQEGRNADIITIDKHNIKDNGQFWLQHSNSNNYFQWAVQTTSARRTIQSTSSPANGTWYFVAGVYDDTDPNYSMKIYVNGVLENYDNNLSGNINPYNSLFRLNIGRLPSGYRLFAGELDEIRIYGRALSQSEIRQQMFSAFTVDTSGLLSYWNFNQSSGINVSDAGSVNTNGIFYSCLVDVHDTLTSPVYRIWDNDKNWTVNCWSGKQIVTVAGDGAGETNTVLSNDAFTLVMQNPWITKPRLDDFGAGTGMTWYGIIDPQETGQWVRATESVGNNTVFINTTSQTSVGSSGAMLQSTITSVPSSSNNLTAYITGTASGAPVSSGETFPPGVDRRSNIIWGIYEWGNVTANLVINFSSVNGINNISAVKLLRRNRFQSSWSEVTSAVLDQGNMTFTLSGVTTFYEYALGGDDGNPLPVKLESFTYRQKDNNITLEWKTVCEINNSRFEIERFDVTNSGFTDWRKIGSLNGFGTSFEEHLYSFSNNGLLKGKYCFRLKQIDYNGNFEYYYLTGSVNVDYNGTSKLFQNYPNPSNPSSVINYSLSVGGKVKLSVYDITGKEVKTLIDEYKESGNYSAEFNGNVLSSGIYFYKIYISNNEYSFYDVKRLILIK